MLQVSSYIVTVTGFAVLYWKWQDS
jgi:hypothetical protein